jgi:hypothetical protein
MAKVERGRKESVLANEDQMSAGQITREIATLQGFPFSGLEGENLDHRLVGSLSGDVRREKDRMVLSS